MRTVIGYILTYTYISLVIIITELIKRKYSLKNEISRKIIHIMVGLSWFIMIYFFSFTYHLMIPPLTFIFINYISYKTNFLKSMERPDKESKGTIYYAISFTILSMITVLNHDFLPFYGIGILAMVLGDGIAPFIGSKIPQYKIKNTTKTYFGSLTIIIITFLLTLIITKNYHLSYSIYEILIISISASILELIGVKGFDNLTLPLGLALISWLLAI
ncbi:MAG: hypothetical protein OSJ63_00130 [Bacilli bacterium]|nr:hypothetical protein [Bacilli bacterium]